MLTVERMVINSVLRPHLYFFTTTPVKRDYLVTTIIGGAVFFIVLAEYSVCIGTMLTPMITTNVTDIIFIVDTIATVLT
jgi:hypothetical protein